MFDEDFYYKSSDEENEDFNYFELDFDKGDPVITSNLLTP